MPVVFVGHGNPMNAIDDNPWSRAFASLGNALPQARAIVAISAHWFTRGTFVTANESPRTIHDFGGFPKALFEVEYPAKGDVVLARRIAEMLDRGPEALSVDWGLDHGTWSVLRRTHPDPRIPVLQVSIDSTAPWERHLALAKALAPLREQGVLIVASGNITHNLGRVTWGAPASAQASTPWAQGFDADIAAALEQRDHGFLTRATQSEQGRASHPTLDHYLPQLYAAGATDAGDAVRFPITGFDFGTISMRAVRWG
jgi:4,5-DOPA dioxygenase extradiol